MKHNQKASQNRIDMRTGKNNFRIDKKSICVRLSVFFCFGSSNFFSLPFQLLHIIISYSLKQRNIGQEGSKAKQDSLPNSFGRKRGKKTQKQTTEKHLKGEQFSRSIEKKFLFLILMIWKE
jgi:hypothetical protein